MHCHLITIEIRIEGSTSKWVELDSFSFDETRLEGLDTKSVKCWCTIEKYVFSFDNFFERIPDFFFSFVDDFFCVFYIVGAFTFDKFTNHKWSKKCESKLFWKPTFIHFEGWSYDDH